MRKLFGTDGIRGTANQEPMTAQTALHVAMAAAAQFRRGDHLHRVLIGKDTRLSGYMIESALVAGFTAMGMDVLQVGPMPTPAVAMLTTSLRADLGVMISASHNPYQDNGIKLFGPDGQKLSDAVEASIEKRIEQNGEGLRDLPDAEGIGRAKRLDDAPGRYIEFAKQTFPRDLTLEGLKLVVDCANGAAYKVAPTVLAELGADVIAMAVEPNGRNINRDCGATATEAMRARVVAEGADLGIALDGDADRLILADEKGARVDGDQLMALIATSWAKAGVLRGDALVATVMSNLGLERYLAGAGIGLTRTAVGDRYVIEAMLRDGVNVGGEQSGHIILSDHLTTGDGLVAALQALAALRRADKPASETCRLFEPLPQFLKNVRVENPDGILSSPDFSRAEKEAEDALGEKGRLLVRKSGTEPLIRVMAEGEDESLILKVVDGLIDQIETMRNGAAAAQ